MVKPRSESVRCYFLMVSVANVTTCRATCKTTQPFNDVLKYEYKDKRLEFEEPTKAPESLYLYYEYVQDVAKFSSGWLYLLE